MDTLNTYQVYTTTPRGAFRLKYEGTSEEEALKAYGKLIDENKPRLLNIKENGLPTKEVMLWGI